MTDQEIASSIIKAEGSTFTNDPKDMGGPTRYGITLKTLSSYLNRTCIIQDVASLTEDVAAQIYIKNYISPLEALPDPVKLSVAHGSVMGSATGVKLLESIIGTKQDGVVGPLDTQAITSLGAPRVNNLYIGAILLQFQIRVNKNNTQIRFLSGWRTRMLGLVV